MKAYKLLKDMPQLKAGAIFMHDKKDWENGSTSYGCLKLAWCWGSTTPQSGWCGETYILPGQLAKDREWFKKIKNKNHRFYLGYGVKTIK